MSAEAIGPACLEAGELEGEAEVRERKTAERERRQVMLSLKKLLAVLVVVVLVAAVAGTTPRAADAGFGSSPGAASRR